VRTHRTPRRAATLALGTALLALLAAAPAAADDDRGLPTVTPTSETPALYDDEAGGNSDADDPAIWRNAADPDRSLVIATAKEGGLRVYDLDARLVQSLPAPRPPAEDDAPGRFNNVDLVTGLRTSTGRADVAVVSRDLVFVAEGQRTNRDGARQVAQAFRDAGVEQVEIVQLPYGCGHLDGMLNIIDRDLALIYPTQLPWRVYELLKARGFRFLDVPDAGEARHGMAINMVPLAPGVVVMPAGNPVTRAALEAHGVTCLEAEVDELMKGAGSVHCMTGVVHREAA